MYNYYTNLKKEKEKEEKLKFDEEKKLLQLKHKSKYLFYIN